MFHVQWRLCLVAARCLGGTATVGCSTEQESSRGTGGTLGTWLPVGETQFPTAGEGSVGLVYIHLPKKKHSLIN